MCLYPKLIRNPKYKSSKKRGYYVPKMHNKRTEYVPVACGKCFECRKKRAREWRIRLAEELRHDNAYFITLTINDQESEKIKKEIGVFGVFIVNFNSFFGGFGVFIVISLSLYPFSFLNSFLGVLGVFIVNLILLILVSIFGRWVRSV